MRINQVHFDAVIFDMDGVLIDSEPLWKIAMFDVFASLGSTLTAHDFQRTVGLRIDQVVEYWNHEDQWGIDDIHSVVDQIIDHVFSGNPAEADHALERALQENQAPDYLLSSALRHAVLLRNARFQQEAGRSVADIERDSRIFYKRQAVFRQQLARWTIDALENAIGLLGDGQNLLRNSKINNRTALSRTFLTIAVAARRTRDRQN